MLFLLSLGLFFACEKPAAVSEHKLFSSLSSEVSHIDFANHITESDSLNYFTYPYLYLGAGVAVGDINNDELPDLYFTGNQVSNKLYLNKGNLVFEDITESAGVGGGDRWHSGATMVDINQDGYLDIYVSVSGKSGNQANQLFINQGNNTFSEEAESYRIADKSTSIQSTFFDYNQDGLLDLFVANYPNVRVSMGNQYYKNKMDQNRIEDSGHLYKNNGNGTFTDVTEESGVRRFGLTLGIIAADFNNDNYQDLYLSNDFNVPDYFYQNNGDGTFSEIAQLTTTHTSMFGMGIDAADFNNDGYTDFLQLDMTAEDYKRSKTNMASMQPQTFYEAVDLGFNYQYMQNCLQLNNGVNNQGQAIFSDISRLAGLATTDWSWGALFADFDNDGWKDVFISNGVKRDVNNNDVNMAYEQARMFGQETNRDFTQMPSTPISNYAFQNKGDYTFTKVSKEWGLDQKGFSNGFATADLDKDGDLDLVINNMDAKASLYINESQDKEHNFIQIKLKGSPENPLGLGAKVSIKTAVGTQQQALTLSRGYQSSSEPMLHFGLGKEKQIEEIIVVWPQGGRQVLPAQSANKTFIIEHNSTIVDQAKRPVSVEPKFEDITSQASVDYTHVEDEYNDYEYEPLLPHKNSQLGPALSQGDVNQDGLDDFFIGGAAGRAAQLFIQNQQGEFTVSSGPWEAEARFEDTGALLFDADKDGDLDLYVVNGGNDPSKGSAYFQDRFYINQNGNFSKASTSLPKITASGLEVVAADYDGDGDQDLFVGGRIVPGKYPYPAQSYILRNEGGKDQELRFVDVTEKVAPELKEAGLVTTALWEDVDLDGKLDLILAGEWMPIRFFKNQGDHFEEVGESSGLGESSGWWYDLQKADLDGDGDMDYFAGNLGLNYKYKSSKEKPFEIYANDFDENGSTDIVLSHHKSGQQVPLRGRECSSQQVPAIAQRFKTFDLFADASLADIYGQGMLDQSLHYQIHTFAHHWIENKGNGAFQMHQLPIEAQFSSIKALHVFNYNEDEYPDLLIAGNLYQAEVETPRADASKGLILIGSAEGRFHAIPPYHSGLFLDGEVRDIQAIDLVDGRKGFLIGRNDLPLQLYTRTARNSQAFAVLPGH
ncbi:MAG: VCBS repeat-containing protein [Bacteroidota bacterium]